MPARRDTQLPPWPLGRARVFGQIAAASAASPEVRWAQLSIRADLLALPGGEGDRHRLIAVATKYRRAGVGDDGLATPLALRESWAFPRYLAHLPAGVPRQLWASGEDPSLRLLSIALRLEEEVVGELRIFGAPAGASVGLFQAMTGQAELLLRSDLLERKLKAADLRKQVVMDKAGDAIFIVSAESGRVVEANRRAAEVSRYRLRDLSGFLLTDLLETPDGGELFATLRSRGRRQRPVLKLLRRKGDPLPVSISAATTGGAHPTWQLIVRDVEKEEQARAQITRAKDTLAAIAMAGVRLQTLSERKEIFEAVGRELSGLGYFSAMLLPEPIAAGEPDLGHWAVMHVSVPTDGAEPPPELLTASFLPQALPPLRKALSSGRPIFSSASEPSRGRGATPDRRLLQAFGRPRGPTQRRRPAGTIWAPLVPQGQVAGALWVAGPELSAADAEGIAAFALQAGMALERARLYGEIKRRSQDLEAEVERRTRELTLAVRALREVDRRKDNFLANVSHELRTPLVTILGYTQLILSERMGPLSHEQRVCLTTAHRNGQKLRDFIEELLDYSRHELTRDTLKRAPFRIKDVIDQAAAAIYPKLLERNLTLQTRVARDTPEILGERERVVQVLTNLLTNGERHCPRNGRLRVAAAKVGDWVRVSVADNGSGIPKEHRARIFDRLYQVGDRLVAREKGAGLGLGLAIARSIVEVHGGRIWIDERVQHGTRFYFELPVAEPQAVSFDSRRSGSL
jgi:signal transduction histidine kinase/PAS domain-containing protein